MAKKVLILTASEGHMSIAKAVDQILKSNHWGTEVANFFDEKPITKASMKLYKTIYRYTPALFKLPFKAGKNKQVQKEVRIFLTNYFYQELKDKIKQFSPQAIITTHFGYNSALNSIKPKGVKLFNVLANPWTIHPLEIEPKMINIAYDQKAAETAHKMGLPKDKIIVAGWFIRQEFYNYPCKESFLKEIGFKKDIFTVLICGGSEGTNSLLTILPSIASLTRPLQLTIICGKNKLLYQSLKILIENSGLFKKNININLVQYTNKMGDYIPCSDLVVGKAGPNFLFETIAAGKPFFAICHISGQEDGNLDIIREKKLGFVEEKPSKAGKLLRKIIEKPEMLTEFSKAVQKEKEYNHRAASILLKILE